MMDDQQRETQQELFQEFSGAPKKPERFPTIAKNHKPILISTTLEQILMVTIIFVLILCGVFFLGVLRGKSLKDPILSTPITPTRVAPTTNAAIPPMRRGTVVPPTPGPVTTSSTTTLVSPAQRPYTIQLVTHRKKDYADAIVASIRKMGFVSFIIPSGEYFQVCVGQYTTKDEAKKDVAFFSTKYKDCFLRHR